MTSEVCKTKIDRSDKKPDITVYQNVINNINDFVQANSTERFQQNEDNV